MRKVVVGLGFGDEGKGLVTDWLCKGKSPKNTVVVRHTGGHQAGHCVTTKDDKHVFSNFGSGTMRGIPTYWNAKTFDPVGFMNEYKLLEKYNPIVYVNPLCPVTTPFEKYKNKIREETNNHGSVGVGFADTIRREEANFHLYVQDLFHSTVFEKKYAELEKFYNFKLTIDEMVHFVADCNRITSIVKCQDVFATNMIFEGSQGLLLDRDYGFFPYVTYGRLGTQETHIKNAEYYLVTRAYQTRHGNGPMSDKKIKNFEVDKDEINVYNGPQGHFKTGILDLDMLVYAATIDKGIRESIDKNLVITCMDQLTSFEVVSNGRIISFNNEKDFVRFIINAMPKMNNVFLSYGPTAETMKPFNDNDN